MPVIIRFKTLVEVIHHLLDVPSIEGIPVIIRFKTLFVFIKHFLNICIEGIPVIIRFKTVVDPLASGAAGVY